eukprot:404700-Pleurochrysis_carterae.AAC.4
MAEKLSSQSAMLSDVENLQMQDLTWTHPRRLLQSLPSSAQADGVVRDLPHARSSASSSTSSILFPVVETPQARSPVMSPVASSQRMR